MNIVHLTLSVPATVVIMAFDSSDYYPQTRVYSWNTNLASCFYGVPGIRLDMHHQ